jgi:hypothetical protein
VTVSAATQVKETRRNAERLPRRAGLLSIARGPRRAPRDEMGGRAARASMTFDVFARCGPRPQRDPGHSSAPNWVSRAAAVGRLLPTSDQILPPGN